MDNVYTFEIPKGIEIYDIQPRPLFETIEVKPLKDVRASLEKSLMKGSIKMKEETDERVFYVVWNPSTGYTRHKHYCLKEAEAEAKRLAVGNTGQEFIVLCSVSKFERNDVTKTTYDPIPF